MRQRPVMVECADAECARTLKSAISSVATIIHTEVPEGEWVLVTDDTTSSSKFAHAPSFCVIIDVGKSILPEPGLQSYITLPAPVRLGHVVKTIAELADAARGEHVPLLPNHPAYLDSVRRELVDSHGQRYDPLTEKESRLLEALARAQGKALSEEALLKGIWAYQPNVHTHTLKTHISRVRNHLQQLCDAIDLILDDDGYRLVAGAA